MMRGILSGHHIGTVVRNSKFFAVCEFQGFRDRVEIIRKGW